MTGTWASKSASDGNETTRSITFAIDSDISSAKLQFNVPGKVVGNIHLECLPGSDNTSQAASEHCASLYPSVYYLFPMGPLQTTAKLTFTPQDGSENERSLSIGSSKDVPGHGGMVRGWSRLSWPRFMNDAYYTAPLLQIKPLSSPLLLLISRPTPPPYAARCPCLPHESPN